MVFHILYITRSNILLMPQEVSRCFTILEISQAFIRTERLAFQNIALRALRNTKELWQSTTPSNVNKHEYQVKIILSKMYWPLWSLARITGAIRAPHWRATRLLIQRTHVPSTMMTLHPHNLLLREKTNTNFNRTGLLRACKTVVNHQLLCSSLFHRRWPQSGQFESSLGRQSHAVNEVALTDIDAVRRGSHAEPQQTGVHLLHLLFRFLWFGLLDTKRVISIRLKTGKEADKCVTLTSWKSEDCPGLTALAGMHMLSSSCWALRCCWRHLDLCSRNCLANSLASLPSPR